MRKQNRKTVRITEEQLYGMIQESIQQMILENPEDELWGGLGALAKRAGQGIANAAKSAWNSGKQAAQSVANTYQQGEMNALRQRIANTLQQGINKGVFNDATTKGLATQLVGFLQQPQQKQGYQEGKPNQQQPQQQPQQQAQPQQQNPNNQQQQQ